MSTLPDKKGDVDLETNSLAEKRVIVLVSRPGVQERRRSQRLPLAIPVFVRGSDEQGKETLDFATILNVSAGGVLITTSKQLRPKSRILLEIPVRFPEMGKASGSQRKLRARLLRIRRTDTSYLCAARFSVPLKMQ